MSSAPAARFGAVVDAEPLELCPGCNADKPKVVFQATNQHYEHVALVLCWDCYDTHQNEVNYWNAPMSYQWIWGETQL